MCCNCNQSNSLQSRYQYHIIIYCWKYYCYHKQIKTHTGLVERYQNALRMRNTVVSNYNKVSVGAASNGEGC